MAVRTTYDAVAQIIEVDATISTDLVPFIETASHLVTRVCTNTGYDAIDLELIERWLAAHFYAIRDPRLAEYQNKVDLGLDVTTYGQQAMRLAYFGELANLNEKIKSGKIQPISVGWVGKTDTDTEDKVTSR
jgi:hypothetical protein